jgi:predicted Zn finger-like uncharacterized protein
MSIPVRCSECRASYTLNDSLAGKKVRCKECKAVITVQGGDDDEPADVLPARRADSDPEGISGRSSGNRQRGAASTLLDDDEDFSPKRGKRVSYGDDDDYDDYDDGDDRHSRRRGRGEEEKEGNGMVLGLVIGGVVLLLLLLGGGGFAWWYFTKSVEDTTNEIVDTVNNPLPTIPAIGGQQPVQNILDPVNVDQAMAELNQPDDSRRLAGARWLTRNTIPPKDKSRVANALVPMLADTNTNVADESRRALERVISQEQVGDLIKLASNQRSNGRLRAMDMLVFLKDPRGAEAIAAYLPQFFDREKARQALEKFGEAAEPAVLKYLFHSDGQVRDMAENLLRGYGTKGDTMLNQALADLKGSDDATRLVILQWLGKQPFDEKFQPKVVAAVTPLLQTLDTRVRAEASTVVAVWGGKENVPSLIKIVESKSGGFQEKDAKVKAMEALARLKDPAGAPPIAALLSDFWVHEQARQALEQMGPVAEDAVLVYLNHPETRYHQNAKDLLAAYKTEAKKMVAQSMKDLASDDAKRREFAAKSLGDAEVVEEQKEEVSKALATILLKEKEYHLREAALIGLEKWGTSNCVEGVAGVFIVDAKSFRGGELRKKALTIMSRMKDPRTAAAVVTNFQDYGQRAETRQTLIDIGPGAEDAVLQMLRLQDANLVQEACVVLSEIGTEKSLAPLKGVVTRASQPRGGNAQLAVIAAAAHKAISARVPKDAPDGKDAKP